MGSGALIGSALLAVGLVACAPSGSAPSGSDSPSEKVPLQTLSVVVPTTGIASEHAIWAAQDQGMFDKAGLTVKINMVKGGAEAVQALASGVADIVDAPTPTVMGAISKQADFKPVYVCRTYWNTPMSVYIPGDSAVKSPADLRGKVIGVENPAGPAAGTARGLMASQGMKEPADYKILTVGTGGQALAAFQRGDIAAYAGGVGDMAIVQAQGFEVKRVPGPESGVANGQGFWVSASAMTTKSAEIAAFLKVHQDGVNYIGQDGAKLAALVAKVAPDQAKDPSVALAASKAFLAMRVPTVPVSLQNCSVSPDLLQSWHKELNGSGAFKGTSADFATYFTNKFVK